MLYELVNLSDQIGILNVFKYITFRTGGAIFTALLFVMLFGPGIIALGEVDLQIVEPAVPVFYLFVALIVLYGVCVVLLTDRLHAAPAVDPGPRARLATTTAQALLAVAIALMAVFTTLDVIDKAGSCLSADGQGGCAAQSVD